jgi:hypothetical protein
MMTKWAILTVIVPVRVAVKLLTDTLCYLSAQALACLAEEPAT